MSDNESMKPMNPNFKHIGLVSSNSLTNVDSAEHTVNQQSSFKMKRFTIDSDSTKDMSKYQLR